METTIRIIIIIIASMIHLTESFRIIFSANATDFLEGSPAALNCIFPADPIFNRLQWENVKNGNTLRCRNLTTCQEDSRFELSRNGYNMTLIIKEVQQDQNKWSCSDNTGNYIEFVTFNVIEESPPPEKPVITANKPQICVGEQMTITCEWRGGQPSASVSLTCLSKTETNKDSVTITETVTRQMSSNCRCEGTHTLKYESTVSNINIRFPPEDKPVITVNKPQICVGEQITATCEWRGGQPGASVNLNCLSVTKTNKDSVTITETVTGGMSHQCRCEGVHDCRNEFTTYELNMQYPPADKPVITVNKPQICVGEQITATCEWRGGQPNASVNLNCLSVTKTNKDSVTITETVTRGMSHQCRCEGVHACRNEFTTYKLNTQYPPADKPVITVNKPQICVGEQITATCEWRGGQPNASVNLNCLSVTKTNKDSVTITETVTRGMSHQCRCEGVHACRNEFTTYKLNTQYPPADKPVITVNKPQICVGEQITATCEWRGGQPNASVNLNCLSVTKTNKDSVTITETVTRGMSHQCRCEGVHACRNEFNTYNINIIYPPADKPVITVNKPQICVGEQITATCEWRGGQPNASVNLNCLSVTKTNKDSVTIIETVTRGMSHQCRCEGVHACRNEFTTYKLNMQYPPPGKPVITVSNSERFPGNQTNITCEWRGGQPSASVTLNCLSATKTKKDSVMITETVTREMSRDCRCEGVHACKNEFTTYKLNIQSNEESDENDIHIWLIVVATVAALLFIIAVGILCIKYQSYSTKKKIANQNRDFRSAKKKIANQNRAFQSDEPAEFVYHNRMRY